MAFIEIVKAFIDGILNVHVSNDASNGKLFYKNDKIFLPKVLLLTGIYEVKFLFFCVILYFTGWLTSDKYCIFLWIFPV